jgi:hypothetical protein
MVRPHPVPLIECAVTFLSAEEGGRQVQFPADALSGDTYRPHLVIGDPSQRRAIAIGSHGIEEYIGVAFHKGPSLIEPGIEAKVLLSLMFHPHQAYDKLQPGVTFTVREGSQVIGFGRVVRRQPTPARS